MTFQRKDININTAAADGINHAVLVRNTAAPLALKVSFQRLWLAKTCERMLLNIGKQIPDALEDTRVSGRFPVFQVFRCFRKKSYFHISSKVIILKLPFLMSSSPWRTISSSSAIGRACSLLVFWVAMRFSERTAFFHQPLVSRDGLECSEKLGIELHFECGHNFLILVSAAKIRRKSETTK